MGKKSCARCGKELQPGGLFYIVHIRILSGFDGILLEGEGEGDQQLKELIDHAELMDPGELDREVYEEILLKVCKSCRDRFADEIQHPWEGPFRIRRDPDAILH